MRRKVIDKYDGPTTLGIDVSRWQGRINWPEVAADEDEIRFAICRTGDGGGRDRRFTENVEGARDAGLVVGSYHYLRADRDGTTQAEIVADLWEHAGGFRPGTDIPPALDLEAGIRTNLPGGVFEGPGRFVPLDVVVEEALEFLSQIETFLGARPIIYTGQAFHWWFSQGNPDLAAKFADWPLWLASYSKRPRMPVDKGGQGLPWDQWTFWQFTGSGEADGIRGDLDLDLFRGSRDELIRWTSETVSRCD